MAGYYRYTAILDACVLYPAPLRDLLLYSVLAGLILFKKSGLGIC
jgi:hypothetical protein